MGQCASYIGGSCPIPKTRPRPPSQAAVAVMASSDAPPKRKRDADSLEPPASTLGARAAQVMEEHMQDEQSGPSNRSGGVLPNDHTKQLCSQPALKRHRVVCFVCERSWNTTSATKNFHCSACGEGPLCKYHRQRGHEPTCMKCFESLVSRCPAQLISAHPGYWRLATAPAPS